MCYNFTSADPEQRDAHRRFVREWIEGEEAERARSLVRSSFRCDRVGQLKMDVRLSDVRTAPVYVPAFVFRSTHFGAKLRTFVSGFSPTAYEKSSSFTSSICLALEKNTVNWTVI